MTKEQWKKVYLTYVNRDHEELAKEAKELFCEVYESFSKKANDMQKGFLFTINLFASYIDADHVISPEEWTLFNYIFGVENVSKLGNIEKLIESYRNFTNSDELDKIIDQCEPELKSSIIKLGLCICAIDERIAISEQEVIEKYAA